MDEPTTFLLTQGVLGVAVVLLIAVAAKFYKKIEDQQDQMIKLLDSRRIESNETTKMVVEVLKESSQNIAILTAKIEAGKADRGKE